MGKGNGTKWKRWEEDHRSTLEEIESQDENPIALRWRVRRTFISEGDGGANKMVRKLLANARR